MHALDHVHWDHRRALSWITATLLLFAANVAYAGPDLELEWNAPPECPDGISGRARVEELIASAPPDAQGTDVQARVEIVRAGNRYRLMLRTAPEGPERVLEGDDCGELGETAALIVAIAVDPRALGGIGDHVIPPPPAPAEPPPREPDTTAAPSVTAPPPPTTSPIVATTRASDRATPTLAGRVAAGLDVGTLPAPTAAFEVSLALLWPNARFEIEGGYVAPRVVGSRRNDAVGVRTQAWSVGARGCLVLSGKRVELPLCALARAGLVHGRGDGELVPHSARQPWVGVGPGLMTLVALRPRLSLAFGLDALVAVVRGGFQTTPSGIVEDLWPVALHVWAGIQWRAVTGLRARGQSRR